MGDVCDGRGGLSPPAVCFCGTPLVYLQALNLKPAKMKALRLSVKVDGEYHGTVTLYPEGQAPRDKRQTAQEARTYLMGKLQRTYAKDPDAVSVSIVILNEISQEYAHLAMPSRRRS